jgi:hypothetical protein
VVPVSVPAVVIAPGSLKDPPPSATAKPGPPVTPGGVGSGVTLEVAGSIAMTGGVVVVMTVVVVVLPGGPTVVPPVVVPPGVEPPPLPPPPVPLPPVPGLMATAPPPVPPGQFVPHVPTIVTPGAGWKVFASISWILPDVMRPMPLTASASGAL